MTLQTPKVELVDYTRDADSLLIFTKGTRLQGRQTLEEIIAWTPERRFEELSYVRNTIKSSFEFVDYTFLISGVSRSFTHQMVRTRDASGIDDPAFGMPDANPAIASFAQESQRTVDASDNGMVMPPVKEENFEYFRSQLEEANSAYVGGLNRGEPPQNARFLLPIAVSTSIIAKFSLRTLHHMAELRLCTRTQGEYQDVFRIIREKVYEVHPWARKLMFLEVFCVNNGICCFPRYDKCPIQKPLFNPETGLRHDKKDNNVGVPERPAKRSEILKMWEETRHEATPVAVAGKTM